MAFLAVRMPPVLPPLPLSFLPSFIISPHCFSYMGALDELILNNELVFKKKGEEEEMLVATQRHSNFHSTFIYTI